MFEVPAFRQLVADVGVTGLGDIPPQQRCAQAVFSPVVLPLEGHEEHARLLRVLGLERPLRAFDVEQPRADAGSEQQHGQRDEVEACGQQFAQDNNDVTALPSCGW